MSRVAPCDLEGSAPPRGLPPGRGPVSPTAAAPGTIEGPSCPCVPCVPAWGGEGGRPGGGGVGAEAFMPMWQG